MLRTSDYDYHLPPEHIAQEPVSPRDASRLMVLDRTLQTLHHQRFTDILDFLNPNDCLVFNDTKVIPARLFGVRCRDRFPTDPPVRIEILLVQEVHIGDMRTGFNPVDTSVWQCLAKPSRFTTRLFKKLIILKYQW